MTEVLGVAEAKRRFAELIDRVGRGERFVVARRGKPVVALVPPDELEDSGRRQTVDLLAFVGALAEVEGFDDVMADVVRSRREERGRPAPTFD
jgi:prevent-host-death family protein